MPGWGLPPPVTVPLIVEGSSSKVAERVCPASCTLVKVTDELAPMLAPSFSTSTTR